MTQNLTRGGLQAAKIHYLVNGQPQPGKEVVCMFNPFEYQITKQNSWAPGEAQVGRDAPRPTFQRGGPMSLSLHLYFDTLAEGTDVRDITNKLWKMMFVNTDVEHPESGNSQPPEVAFEWGRLYFKAVILNMTQKFLLFKADGTPVRAEINLSLQQMFPDNQLPEQEAGAVVVQSAIQPITAVAAQRIDNIAAQVGEPATVMRALAENSNIDNPLNIVPGQLLTPPSPQQLQQAAQQLAQQAAQQVLPAVQNQAQQAGQQAAQQAMNRFR
jgi:hypothetical protein